MIAPQLMYKVWNKNTKKTGLRKIQYINIYKRALSETYSYQEATKRYQKLNSGYQNEIPTCTRGAGT